VYSHDILCPLELGTHISYPLVWVLKCCPNKVLQIRWLRITEIYFLFLGGWKFEVKVSAWLCSFGDSGEAPSLLLPSFWWWPLVLGMPWLAVHHSGLCCPQPFPGVSLSSYDLSISHKGHWSSRVCHGDFIFTWLHP
jgi:hypothetical protein